MTTWLRTRTARLLSALRALGEALAPDALSLGKLALCCGWAWLPFEGIARAIAWEWHTAAQCWGAFCGAIVFVLWRPAPVNDVDQIVRGVVEALTQRTEGR